MALQFAQYLVLVPMLLLFTTSVECASISITDIEGLDKQFKILSAQVYNKSNIEKNNAYIKFKTIQSLYSTTQKLTSQNKHIEAIKYVTSHQQLIKQNIDDVSIFFFIELLIKHNEWNTVTNLYQYIIKEGDKSLVSNITFQFVKYYSNRNKWQKTLNLLSGIIDDLAIDDGHYALIMTGITLQHLKQHRHAVKFYKQVPISSKYYSYAQLNIAIAYIRQGWWTDAHRLINKLLKKKSDLLSQQQEFINRLYLVMGYSYLQQEYYREAREAFRNIRLDSKYTNRALLGLSLAAASQGDNIGSLNILTLLQNKNTQDLPVEESYLLLPFVYEKLGQHKTSSANYSTALAYYQKRIHEINSIIREISMESVNNISIKNNAIFIQNNTIRFPEKYPDMFLNNLQEINAFKNNISESKLLEKINSLKHKYNKILLTMVKEGLQERLKSLQSYLNQSRYGLARLYDNSKTN